MVKIYKMKSALNTKTDQELFNIYLGEKKLHNKEIRYLAARILEERSFRFNDVNSYHEIWNKEKALKKQERKLSSFSYYFQYHKALSISIIISVFILLFFMFFQLSPSLKWLINLNDMMLFAINILSFASLFVVFGFIGFILRNMAKTKHKKRMLEMSH